MSESDVFPVVRQVVLDCENPRQLAEFYRQLFGLGYRPGDEPPDPGQPDPLGADWLVLRGRDGGVSIAFQRSDQVPESTWPDPTVPQMLHLDTSVSTAAELTRQHGRALALGARLVYDRFDDPDEPLYVFADPAGHPFCVFVGE